MRVTLAVTDPMPTLSAIDGTAALQAASGLPQAARLHHLGLTASRVEWGSEIDTRWRETPGGTCARPARIDLRLAQTEHGIRIAREVPRGGCLWRAVEAHERRHTALNQATLRRAATAMRRAAEAWAPRAEGHGPDAAAAVAQLQAGLRQAIEPALAAMRAARDAGHAAIDSPEEYARLSRLCPADQAVLRRALGLD
ncbi:hypothetical protein ACFQS7_14490 [Dankookia sp. GCM10030260]|uniref:hypothetical protein n=1 Tax=Dankookia sp. GCM10030260 TaxID=3273390 RepID=UPI00360A92FA